MGELFVFIDFKYIHYLHLIFNFSLDRKVFFTLYWLFSIRFFLQFFSGKCFCKCFCTLCNIFALPFLSHFKHIWWLSTLLSLIDTILLNIGHYFPACSHQFSPPPVHVHISQDAVDSRIHGWECRQRNDRTLDWHWSGTATAIDTGVGFKRKPSTATDTDTTAKYKPGVSCSRRSSIFGWGQPKGSSPAPSWAAGKQSSCLAARVAPALHVSCLGVYEQQSPARRGRKTVSRLEDFHGSILLYTLVQSKMRPFPRRK